MSKPTEKQGSKKSLIAAYVLDGKGGGRSIGWDEIKTWTEDQGTLWMHMDYSVKKTWHWLSKSSGLDAMTAKAMVVEDSRPRSVVSEQGVLLFLRGVNLNPGQEPEDMVSIRLWLEKNRVITTRRRLLLSIQDIYTAFDKGLGPKNAAELLTFLNGCLINRMANVIDDISDRVDALESEVATSESHLLRPKIADIRREAILIRRYLAPQREALYRLQIEEIPFLGKTDQLNLREGNDRLIRYIEELDTVRDRASITQEELASRLSEQMDKRMYVLSVVALIFLPLTFLTGLLGINVGGIPGADYKWSFLIVCTGLGVITLLTMWYLHIKKWV